jgi:hypothetical protein
MSPCTEKKKQEDPRAVAPEEARPTESSPLQGAPRPPVRKRAVAALKQAGTRVWSFGKAVKLAGPLLVVFLLLSTVIFMALEKFSGRDAFYFCMVLLTTVGYGDISPVTPGGKLFTMLFIIVGLTIGATTVGVIVDAFAELASHGQKRFEPPNVRSHLMGLTQAVVLLILVNVVGACWFMVAESANALDGFYWALITSSTVGLGDFPTSGPTRTFNCIYLLISVGCVAFALGKVVTVITTYGKIKRIAQFVNQGVTAELVNEIDQDKSGEVDRFEFCSYMLVNLGKVEQSDIDEVLELFRSYDLDGSGTVNCKDVQIANRQRNSQA